jgi:diguanylate cyclase (GGDEF)-like protein
VTGGLHRAAPRKTGTILLANSDPELLHILEFNLLHANLDVVATRSGAEVLARVSTVRPDIIILDTALPDINVSDVCRKLKESPPTSLITIIAIGARSRKKGRDRAMDEPNHYIAKPFDPQEVVAIVLRYLTQKERAENTDSFTGLANQTQVNLELSVTIEQQKTFAAMYITMDDLKAFNRAYGLIRGDGNIRLLANIISEAVRLFGNADDLVAHLGGDKFAVLTTPYKARTLCRRIIADFNRRFKTLYAGEYLTRGFAAFEHPVGSEATSPMIGLRVAVVTNQKRTFNDYLEVGEAAEEQMEYLKQLPGNVCYFDLTGRQTGPVVPDAGRAAPHIQQEELKTMHRMLAWLDFLVDELNRPLADLKAFLEKADSREKGQDQEDVLKKINETVGQIVRAAEAINSLNWADHLAAGASFEEMDIEETLDWVVRQTSALAELRKIRVGATRTQVVGRFLADRRSLTQALLYVARAELATAPRGSELLISATEINDDFIIVTFYNPGHHTPQRALSALLQGQLAGLREGPASELYPAKLLVQGIGGKLGVSSEKEKGTVYTITIPKGWQSQLREVNALKLAAEISRKEARAELRKIQEDLALPEGAPAPLGDSLARLRGKVQELGVLCNRSLFLADDMSNQLELQQEQLLQQEEEHLATAEAMLNICRESARAMGARALFDAGSAGRVVLYALAIANELSLSIFDRQALHRAALLKDLGLVLFPHEMVEQKVVPTLEEAVALRVRFNRIWKALSAIPFLSPALALVRHRYERWDGAGGPLSLSGDDIPSGARILAVADAFDAEMAASARNADQAVRQIVNNAGLRFDPDVVNAFVRVWRTRQFEAVPDETGPAAGLTPGEAGKSTTGESPGAGGLSGI